MVFLLIRDGLVVNLIAADEVFAQSLSSGRDAVMPSDGVAGIGWSWDGERFTAPPVVGDPVPQPTPLRRISVGAFFDRFGPAKWAILAEESPQVRAVVRDASVRSFIDLDNPDLPAGLAILQAAGHEIDAEAIVDAPVAPNEVP